MSDDTEHHELRITLRDVFHAQQEQGRLLATMASDIKRALDSLDRTKDSVADHEERIRALEKKVWQAAGAASFVGSLLSVFVSLVVK